MPNELPLPPELHQLLEKRDEPDRRVADRRSRRKQTAKAGQGPTGAATPDPAAAPAPDRRSQSDRRQSRRRQADQ